MTGPADCRDIRQALGVYVLGAIDPAERSLVDAHLSTCPECREELAGLASLPALLRRVPVAEAQELAGETDDDLPGAIEPSEFMLRSLLNRASRERRARRWRSLAAAAAVVVVAGTAGAVGWNTLHHPGTSQGSGGPVAAQFESVSATSPQTHVTATIRYAPRNWGLALDTKVHNVPYGATCQLQVTDSAGRTHVVGGWTTSYDEGTTWYPGATSLTEPNVRSFQITSHGKVLVTVPAHETGA